MQETTKSKIRGGLLIFFFVYIFAWGISGCDAGKAQAKSITNKNGSFTLDKDIADGQWKITLADGLKKYQIQTVSSEDGHPVRAGDKSIRFEVRDGDCSKSKNSSWSDCKNDRERAELQSLKLMKKGEYWWTWSIYLPNDFESVFPANLNLGQFHTEVSSGHPYFMFYNQTWNKQGEYSEHGGGLHMANQMRSHYDDSYNGPSVLIEKEQLIGHWNDIVVNVNFTPKDDGWFKIWVNGKLVFEYHGATKVKAGKADFQFGIYRSYIADWREITSKEMPTQIVYFDEIRYAKKCKKLNLARLGYSCKALENQTTEITSYGHQPDIDWNLLTKDQKKQKRIIETLTVRIAKKVHWYIKMNGDSNPSLKEIESWVNLQLLTMDWDDNLEKLKDRKPTQERLIKNGIKQFI